MNLHDVGHALGRSAMLLVVALLGLAHPVVASTGSQTNVVFFQGLKHTSLGSAVVSIVEPRPGDSLAVVSGIGSSGSDGVAVDLGGAAMSWTATMVDPDSTATLHAGSFIEAQAIGNLSGTPNQLIAMNHFERDSSGLVEASASFTPLGAATYAIEIFNHSHLVANLPGRSGIAYLSPFWPRKLDIPWILWAYYHILCNINSYSSVVSISVPGAGTFMGDEVRLMAETTISSMTMPTEIRIFGRSVSSIAFSTEAAMHGMQTLGQYHSAALDSFQAHNPIPPGTVRSTAAVLDSSLNVLSTYVESAGFPAADVTAGSDSVRAFLDGLGMLYVDGGTTYFGASKTTDAFAPFVTSALVARGGFFTPALKTQVDSVNVLAVAGQDSAALAYVSGPLTSTARPITELVDAAGFVNVFQTSYARHASSATRSHSALWDALGSILLLETGPIGSILGGAVMSDLADEVFGSIVARPTGGTFQNVGYAPQANSAPDVRSGSLFLTGTQPGPYGVSLNLGYVSSFDASFAAIDSGGTAAAGTAIRAEARGTVNQVANHSLGVLTLTKDPLGGPDILVSVDFSAIGSSTARVQVWSGGVMQLDIPGHATPSVGRASTWYRHLKKLGGGIECYVGDFPPGTVFTIDGTPHTGDELRVLAETTSRINVKTGLDLTASLLPSFSLNDVTVTVISGVDGGSVPAAPVILAQNRPNPFNPSTTIEYQLRSARAIRVDVYGTSGEHVRTLWRGLASAGANTVRWDGLDDRGNPVASGVYMYVVAGSDLHASRRMVLLR